MSIIKALKPHVLFWAQFKCRSLHVLHSQANTDSSLLSTKHSHPMSQTHHSPTAPSPPHTHTHVHAHAHTHSYKASQNCIQIMTPGRLFYLLVVRFGYFSSQTHLSRIVDLRGTYKQYMKNSRILQVLAIRSLSQKEDWLKI